MLDELSQAVLRYTQANASVDGVVTTPVPGLLLIQSKAPSQLEHAIVRPLVCLVLRGRKEVTIGNQEFVFGAGDAMIVTGNVPTVSRISVASAAAPYLALALELDTSVVTELDMCLPAITSAPELKEETGTDLRDAVLRLVRLLQRPASLAVLKDSLVREIHYWLLLGPQGQAIRRLGLPDSHAQRIARAISILRTDYAQPLPIERLASAAGMSRSAFHGHFRSITSLTPVQFQKQLRLIEARRLILSKGRSSSRAAFEVGYESVSQFTREYARMYGLPPLRDKQAAGTSR